MKNSRLAALLVVFAALVAGLWFFLRSTDADAERANARKEAADVAKSRNAVTPLDAPVSESEARRERDSAAENSEKARAKAQRDAELPCRFEGVVVDDQNLPVRGGRWRLVALDGSQPGRGAELHGFDDDARFAFTTNPGSFDLVVTGPRKREQHVRLDFALEAPLTTRTIVLVGVNQVFVRILSSAGGRPFRSTPSLSDGRALSVLATKNAPTTKRASAIPSEERADHAAWQRNSGWESDPSQAVEWVIDLDAPPPVYVSAVVGDVVLATGVFDGGEGVVTLLIADEGATDLLASLRLRVVDADGGNPIATVRFAWSEANLPGDDALSDENGVIAVSAPPGKRDFVLAREGYETLSGTLTLLASDKVDFGDFVLTPVTSIEGRVVDASGRPIDLRLDLIPLEDDNDLAAGRARHLRDLDLDHGVFHFEDVGRALYLLRIRDETVACDPLLVDTRTGSVNGLELRARPGTRVTFDYHAGERPVRFRLDVLEGKDKIHYHGRENGEAALTLPPGHYDVRIDRLDETGGETAHFERGLDVGAEPITITLTP